MYLVLFLVVPFLYLFNTYLAVAGLVAAIVVMYVQRTRSTTCRGPRRALQASSYKAGYED